MDIERCFNGTIDSVKLQKSGNVEASLDFAIFALYNDGISFDRLSGEHVRGRMGHNGGESAHGHCDRTFRRL